MRLNKSEEARKAFSRAADLLADASKRQSGNQAIATRKLLQQALLEEVRVAEANGNATGRIEAYNHYLKLHPEGEDAAKIRYQIAKAIYDRSEYEKAFDAFDEIVRDKSFTHQDLKTKAAHLALDSLVLTKNIERLEEKSLDYGRQFPREAIQFHQISRRAGLQIASSMAKKDSSTSTAEKALEKLNSITLVGTSRKELHSYHRMKIDLALKARQWHVAQKTLNQFLGFNDLTENDRQWALKEKMALAELLLDFNNAYQLALKMDYLTSDDPKLLLKGALLADLSKRDPTPWLQKVIQSRRATKQQSLLARAQLVRLSPNQWRVLRQQSQHFINHPSLMADLALESFDSHADFSQANWALTQRGVNKTWAGQTLKRMLVLSDLKEEAQKISRQRLNHRTDSLLGSSLRNRIDGLAKLKLFLREAQRQADWTLQIVSASLLRNENHRLGKEIQNLPIPRRLSSADKKAYQQGLEDQASPFLKAAQELDGFLAESWKDPRYLENLLERIDNQDSIRGLLMNELRSLAAFAPASTVGSIKTKLAQFKDRPSSSQIMSARSQLRRDPFDLDLQNQLLLMEKKVGNQSMVVFLQARGNSIKAGDK
jgi:hypothetical protein